MDSNLGPGRAERLSPARLEERQPQEQQERKRNRPPMPPSAIGAADKDRADVAATEPEIHKLDERA